MARLLSKQYPTASLTGREFDGRTGPTYLLLVAQALLIASLIVILGFDYVGDDINIVLAFLGLIVAAAWCCRGRGMIRVADGLEAISLLMLSSMVAACLSTLVTTIGFPLRDTLLADADRLLVPFLSWPDMACWLAGHDNLVDIMCRVYSTFLWQPFVLVVALAAAGRSAMLWRFMYAWTAVLAAAVVIYAFMPSVTAFVFYGFTPADVPALTVNAGWRPAELILQLRSGELRAISTSSMTGLIDFPSFHTAGSILLAWGFSRVPLIGGPFVLLNLALIPTIPFVGSHYFVDVIAGAVLAWAGIAAVKRMPLLELRNGDAPATSGL